MLPLHEYKLNRVCGYLKALHVTVRLSKKWLKVPFLAETFKTFIRSKKSFTALIWHSADNKRVFNRYVPRLKGFFKTILRHLKIVNLSLIDLLCSVCFRFGA